MNGCKMAKSNSSNTSLNSITGSGKIVGESDSENITGSSEQDQVNAAAGDDTVKSGDKADHLLGGSGSDSLDGGSGNDLAAGDYVSTEWTFVDGKWVYTPELLAKGTAPLEQPADAQYDDTIVTGDGDDVLLGNLGDDLLSAGAGEDTINAGTGNDTAFGGDGDDKINLEKGDDVGYGGAGADTINAGAGDDLLFGDHGGQNLLNVGAGDASAMSQYADIPGWTVSQSDDSEAMSQTVETKNGDTYTIEFDVAANLAGGALSGTVEVLWNGEVIDTISVTSGVYETHAIEVTGTGDPVDLTFRTVETEQPYTGPEIDMSGPIFSYEKSVTIDGQDVTVDAFAPAQAKLYQVIDGHLKVFDPESETYEDAGNPTGFKINAVGFNVEDDLIYGIAKSTGTDALGNAVSRTDLVMMDANGNAYRVGDAPYGDYVGDFDGSGNLWTFHTGMNRVTKIDVDNIGANGNPKIETFDLPDDLFGGRLYDIAYSSDEGVFYAVESPPKNGMDGKVHRIDMSDVENGGSPEISSVPLSATLFGDDMVDGGVAGSYGAVFMDGGGNLFIGLNRGDHDLDGSTGAKGAIYQVHADFDAGTAYAEFRAEAQSTGSNDGAVDPRSVDPFAPVDADASILIRNPSIENTLGGNDNLRGGSGDDTMFGEAGDDKLFGGSDNDHLDGGIGSDKLSGGQGDDALFGQDGADKLTGNAGSDSLDGGAGKDYLNAGSGSDKLVGGAGDDKMVGGTGSDTLEGGAGDDHMWGGNWQGDGSSDTFVVAQGSGKDMVHDFEAENDVIDLSAYGLEFSDVTALMDDQGWATVIDLSGLEGAQSGDKLILKSVSADDLDEDNFIL